MVLRQMVAVAACVVVFLSVPQTAGAQRQDIAGSPTLQAVLPAVEGFVLERVAQLRPGTTLAFSVFGTRRSAVTVYVEGVQELVELREVQPGVYEGGHVLADRDRARPDSEVVATLQHDGRVARAVLGGSLLLSAAPLPWADARLASSAAQTAEVRHDAAQPIETLPTYRVIEARRDRTCADCAVVESIRIVDADDRSAIARAFDDHRRRMLGILDTLGVPAAARERQRIAEQSTAHEVVLRRADGRAEVRLYTTRPAFETGDTVRLLDDDRRGPIPGA